MRIKLTTRSSDPAPYAPDALITEDAIIAKAMGIMRRRLFAEREAFTSPGTVSDYLKLLLAELQHEEFHAMYLNNRHELLGMEMLFTGTIDGCAVYPREVIRSVLSHNAAAVIFVHNHPSGTPTPSQADHNITRRLREALQLIDVRVLDHIIVAGTETYSFAEHGDI